MNANSANTASSAKMKSCSYYKKYGCSHNGYTWWEYVFLKEDHNKKKKKQAEAAHVTTDVNIQSHLLSHPQTKSNWIFDTTTSAHMLSNLDKFDTITEDHGIVKVSGKVYLKYEGRGSCLVYPLLPDGSIN